MRYSLAFLARLAMAYGIFLTSDIAYQGVVVLQISGVLRAVSIRAELIYERYRITDIVLI